MKNPFKRQNKVIIEECTAIFIDEVGAINPRVFKILDRKDGFALISFSEKEKYKIKERYIRRKRVIIYKLKNGNIQVQNPDKWREIDLKGQGIKVLRFNLQNWALQESKAANRRWILPQDMIAKLTPLFKILMISIAVGVIGWAGFKFAAVVLEKVLASRAIDCASLLPNIPNPLGATTTAPLGA